MLFTELDYKFYKQTLINGEITYEELFVTFEEAVKLSKVYIIIFCQFTGVYDKNGTKIYVGDIISYFDDDSFYSEILFQAPSYSMRWYNPKVRKLRHEHKDVEPILSTTHIVGTNIGNIYANNSLHEELNMKYSK